MHESFLKVISEANSLNSEIFSLPRMELLASLLELGRDGATYRELRAALTLSDGTLYANIKALEKMRYIQATGVKIEGKDLESYYITPDGAAEWARIKDWLYKFLVCGGKQL